MILFNVGLALIVLVALSLLLGALLSTDKTEGIGATLRRGLGTLLLIGLLVLVFLAVHNDPALLQQVMNFFEHLFAI